MTYEATQRQDDGDRTLALVNYGLLFAAIFFAGATALAAIVIAYVQRDAAGPTIRSHFDFQIRIFWIGFALALAAGISGLAAVVNCLGALFRRATATGWEAFETVHVDVTRLTFDGTIVGLVVAALILSFLAMLWMVAASAFGFIRLASERGIGDSRPS